MADEKGFTLWFTGLSCAGKTTVSKLVEDELRSRGSRVEILDGVKPGETVATSGLAQLYDGAAVQPGAPAPATAPAAKP